MIKFFVVIVLSSVYFTLSAMPQYKIAETSAGYDIQITVPPIVLTPRHIKQMTCDNQYIDKSFVRLTIPGFSTGSDNVGGPEDIAACFQIAAENREIEISVDDINEETVVLTNQLFPAQPSQRYCKTNPESEYFAYDVSQYTLNRNRQKYAEITQLYEYRGLIGAEITLNPVYYNAPENKITYAKSFTIHINLKKPRCVRSWSSQDFDHAMRSIFVNLQGETGRNIASEAFRAGEKYLVLSSAAFKDNADLKKWADWRISQGHSVEIVDKSEAGSTKEEFTKYIRGKKPAYCILVGAPKDYPNYTQSYSESGQKYTAKSYTPYVSSTVESPKPDICLGLFFVKDASGIANIVAKTMDAEKNINSYPKVFLGAGGHSGNSMTDEESGKELPANHCDIIVEEMYNQYFKSAGYDGQLNFLTKTPKYNLNNIISAFNKGVRFINYNGHGGNTGWTPPGASGLSTSSLSSLTNTVYPFMLTCACLTGTFTDNASCMQQAFSASKKGPAATIGSYEVSFMGQHALNRALFRQIMQLKTTKFGLAYFTGTAGYVYDTAKSSPKQAQMAVSQYHFYGDPSVQCLEGAATDINKEKAMKNDVTIAHFSFIANRKNILFQFSGKIDKDAFLSVYDCKGVLVYSQQIENSPILWNKQSFSGKHTSAGTYLAVLKTDRTQKSLKFTLME